MRFDSTAHDDVFPNTGVERAPDYAVEERNEQQRHAGDYVAPLTG